MLALLMLCSKEDLMLFMPRTSRKGRSDSEQTRLCRPGRTLFSDLNVRDFVLLHNQYAAQDKVHWGIIVSKQLPIGETLRRLLKKIGVASRDDFNNRIEFL